MSNENSLPVIPLREQNPQFDGSETTFRDFPEYISESNEDGGVM